MADDKPKNKIGESDAPVEPEDTKALNVSTDKKTATAAESDIFIPEDLEGAVAAQSLQRKSIADESREWFEVVEPPKGTHRAAWPDVVHRGTRVPPGGKLRLRVKQAAKNVELGVLKKTSAPQTARD